MANETIKEWQQDVHWVAWNKGWYDDWPDVYDPHHVASRLANITSECSEALEDLKRAKKLEDLKVVSRRLDYPKPLGFGIELADIVIRTMDLAELLDIDLQKMMEEKHAYNKTRKHRHGGKSL